jgi:excisionase family DNA binding protein
MPEVCEELSFESYNPNSFIINDLQAAASAMPATSSIADSLEGREVALTVKEVATLLACSRQQIYKLVDENRLPAVRMGTMLRFDPGSLAAWIRHRMNGASN